MKKLYPFVIGIPSLITAAISSDHKSQPHERNASRLGAEYFDKKYGSGADGYIKGSEDYFDIDAFGSDSPSAYKNPRIDKITVTTIEEKQKRDWLLYNSNRFPM